MHGKVSIINHYNHPLFAGVPDSFDVMRYHSLIIEEPKNTNIEVIARAQDDTIMAIAHRQYPCLGVQFHPESVGTTYGQQIINNWARLFGLKK